MKSHEIIPLSSHEIHPKKWVNIQSFWRDGFAVAQKAALQVACAWDAIFLGNMSCEIHGKMMKMAISIRTICNL